MIVAVRHPEDEMGSQNILNGQSDTKLTPLGEQQRAELPARIRKEFGDIGLILTSPLGRARITALDCQKEFKSPYLVLKELIERNCGVCTGIHYSELHLHAKEVVEVGDHSYVVRAEGYEEDKELFHRAAHALNFVTELGKTFSQSKPTVIFSHGALLKMMKIVVKDLGHPSEFHMIPNIKNAEPFILVP